MPMIAAMTAAEIAAAAEAAAAATAAAEAAAAAQAASAAGTAATAATAAPTVAAAAAPSAGILGAELGAANALSGAGATQAGIVSQAAPAIEAATAVGGQGAGTAATQAAMESTMQSAAGAPASLTPPAGITAVPEAATTVAPAGEVGMSEAQRAYLEASQASIDGGIAQGVKPLPAYQTTPMTSSPYSLTSPTTAPGSPSLQYQLTQPGSPVTTEGLKASASGAQGMTASSPGASSFGNVAPEGPSMFDKFSTFADKHPFMTGAALYTGAYNLGLLDQKQSEMPQKKTYGKQYKISDNFQAPEATPNVYSPSYRTYAEGGVMEVGGPSSEVAEPRKVDNPMATISDMANMADGGYVPGYAKGGSAKSDRTLSSSLDFYKSMTEGQTSKGASAPKGDADVGIYYDLDPETRYQDALTAAQIRQSKLENRANLQLPKSDVMKRPTPAGKLNLAPPGAKAQDGSGTTEAAQGGIMQAGSSLGGYAAGGNPRLLKGPGDGMSDNIPAMIGSKQPARLADGEFVIPADVVSHLGNGSTEAGAKRLHEMMSKVRKDRTGNPKQGKQINPRKYLPK
jgi:hypothetical protein